MGEDEVIEYGDYTVKNLSERSESAYVVRDLQLEHTPVIINSLFQGTQASLAPHLSYFYVMRFKLVCVSAHSGNRQPTTAQG